MAFETNSPNMSLPIPGVGLTNGPQYATDVNNCLTILDAHSHTPGSGVPITPAAININTDLPFNAYNATLLRSSRYAPQNAALTLTADIGCLFVVGVDLYYNDVNGNHIRLTQSGSIVGTAGSITGLPSGTASVSYAAGTFTFQSATNTSATIDGQSFILRNNTAGSHGLTLAPPNSMGADYTLVLPSVPSVPSVVTLDTAGNLTASIPVTYLSPAGSVVAYAGSTAPSGWLICDGSAISRTTYATLFAVVGSAFGYGDNSTTFNIPDLRGQFIRGVDGTANRDPDHGSRTAMNTGGNTGNAVGSVQSNATAKNGLALTDPGHTHFERGTNDNSGSGALHVGLFQPTGSTDQNSASATVPGGTGITLGNGDSETRPTNAYLNYIIKI